MKFLTNNSSLLSTSALLLLLSSSSVIKADDNNMMDGCVESYEEGKDYFPNKVEIDASEHWTITYENSYKIVTNTDAGQSYLLYQCGTPIPEEEADKHDAVISIPITEGFGLHYTTFIPYLELLGVRSGIEAMSGQASWIYSPCLKDMIDKDMVTMVGSLNNETMLGEIDVNHQELPYFIGVGTDNVFENSFEISEWKETNMMAIYEWIKFFSVFFNRERFANALYDSTKDHVECAKENANIVSADEDKPVVLWASYSAWCGGWDVARSCPNYYCELADTCAATLLTSLEGSVDAYEKCYRNYMTTEEFVEFGKDADIWVYSNGDFETILSQYSEELKDFKSIINDKLFDIAGSTMDAWFAERKTEPDTLIQDFCHMVGRENPAGLTHQPVFIRQIDDAIKYPSVCTDYEAPLIKLGSHCERINAPPRPATEPPAPSDGELPALCFSGDTTVNVLNKGTTLMKNLKIGDKIEVEQNKYETIYSFGHYNLDVMGEYVQLRTANKNTPPLELTKDHMIFSEGKAIAAGTIKVGDLLDLNNDGSHVEVTQIVHGVKRQGAIAPFTTSGTLSVNGGILASSYVNMMMQQQESVEIPFFSMQQIAHLFNAPHRLVCAFNFGICERETYTKEGISTWVSSGHASATWLLRRQQNTFVTVAVLTPIVTIFLAIGALEYIMNNAVFVSILLASVMYYYGMTCRKSKKTA